MASGFGYSRGSVAVDDAVGGKVRNACVLCERDHKTTTASLICTTCDERMCLGCSKKHQKYALGNHVLVDINASDCVKTQVDMKGYDRCKDHSRVLVYVCQDHNKALCCDECLFASHRKCDRVDKILQSTSSNGQQSALNDTEVRRIVAEAERLAIASEKKVKENEKQANNLCEEIDNNMKCVMAMFDEAKTRIRRELSAGNASDEERLDKRKVFANSIKSDLEGAAIDTLNKKCVILDAGLQRSGPPYRFKEMPRDVTCYSYTNLAVTLGYGLFFIYTIL